MPGVRIKFIQIRVILPILHGGTKTVYGRMDARYYNNLLMSMSHLLISFHLRLIKLMRMGILPNIMVFKWFVSEQVIRNYRG